MWGNEIKIEGHILVINCDQTLGEVFSCTVQHANSESIVIININSSENT